MSQEGRIMIERDISDTRRGNEQVSEIHQFDYSENGRSNGTASPIQTSAARPGIPAQTSDNNCLADVEERIIFRPGESDEIYSARLTIKNVASQGKTLIVKIKTTSPDRYRVKPIIFVLTRNATATINIDTHPGITASTMLRDRFQVQVAVVPANMMPASSSELSDTSNTSSINNFNDLGNNFKQIVSSGTLVETYKVTVSVEARAGDNGSGSSIALSDERLRRGLEDLEKKITESVSNQVLDKIAKNQRMLMIPLGVLIVLFLCILYYLNKLSGDCSRVCIDSGHWTESKGAGPGSRCSSVQ